MKQGLAKIVNDVLKPVTEQSFFVILSAFAVIFLLIIIVVVLLTLLSEQQLIFKFLPWARGTLQLSLGILKNLKVDMHMLEWKLEQAKQIIHNFYK